MRRVLRPPLTPAVSAPGPDREAITEQRRAPPRAPLLRQLALRGLRSSRPP